MKQKSILIIDAQKIADWLGISLKEFAPAINIEFSVLRENSSPLSRQFELCTIKDIIDNLSKILEQHEDRINWLNSRNPIFKDKRPMDLILSGHAEVVHVILSNALDGLPS